MITQIRKVGNSAGVVIPSALLKEVKLTIGAEIDLTVENGVLNIKPVKEKRQGSREVSLNWLLADFQDVEGELIPGAVGAEVLEDDDANYRSSPETAQAGRSDQDRPRPDGRVGNSEDPPMHRADGAGAQRGEPDHHRGAPVHGERADHAAISRP